MDFRLGNEKDIKNLQNSDLLSTQLKIPALIHQVCLADLYEIIKFEPKAVPQLE